MLKALRNTRLTNREAFTLRWLLITAALCVATNIAIHAPVPTAERLTVVDCAECVQPTAALIEYARHHGWTR